MKNRDRVLLGIVFALVLAWTIQPAAAKVVLKYGHIAPEGTPHGITSKAFAEYVKARTNGELQIDVFPAGQLGGERSMAEQCQGGTLDMIDITTAVLSNFVPELALYDLPFLWPSRGVAYAVVMDPEFQRVFFDLMQAKGFFAVGYNENEFRDFSNTKREIRTPADMKGLKVRVMESPICLDTFKALGASPIAMPFPEIYSALQQGTVDAQENPLVTTRVMKFLEVCPYVTLTQHMLTESIAAVNLDRWNQLSKEHQQVLQEAAQRMSHAVHALNTKVTVETIAKVRQEGKIKLTRLSPAERAEFVKAVKPVHEQYETKFGTIANKPEYGRFAGMSYYRMIQEKIAEYE